MVFEYNDAVCSISDCHANDLGIEMEVYSFSHLESSLSVKVHFSGVIFVDFNFHGWNPRFEFSPATWPEVEGILGFPQQDINEILLCRIYCEHGNGRIFFKSATITSDAERRVISMDALG